MLDVVYLLTTLVLFVGLALFAGRLAGREDGRR